MMRRGWRAAAATWGGAAWLVLQQFGVPAAPRVTREQRIVQVEEASRVLETLERLPDGRILTVPLGGRGQDAPDRSVGFSAN